MSRAICTDLRNEQAQHLDRGEITQGSTDGEYGITVRRRKSEIIWISWLSRDKPLWNDFLGNLPQHCIFQSIYFMQSLWSHWNTHEKSSLCGHLVFWFMETCLNFKRYDDYESRKFLRVVNYEFDILSSHCFTFTDRHRLQSLLLLLGSFWENPQQSLNPNLWNFDPLDITLWAALIEEAFGKDHPDLYTLCWASKTVATSVQIKKAYHKKALEWHPDKNTSQWCQSEISSNWRSTSNLEWCWTSSWIWWKRKHTWRTWTYRLAEILC